MSAYKTTRQAQQNPVRRGKQYSPSKNAIYSSLAVQQDQKQIIIQKLRQEIHLLQKKQSQFASLKEHYKKLDHQFNLLFNQKKSNDQSFAKHHEAALKQICIMKNEIDSMKIQFRQNKLQIEDLSADENTLKNQLDQKQIQIQKLKNQLRSSIADNEQLNVEHQKLVDIHRNVSVERQNRAEDCQKMKMQIEKVAQKIGQLKNYQSNLQKQQNVLTTQIIKYQEQNNRNDENISAASQDLAILQSKIEESQQQITHLQRNTAQTNTLSDKFKNESLFYKKSIQAQVMKNNDTTKNIQQAENLLNVRVNQVNQGHRELQVLTQENISLQKVNTQLEDDLQACKRHLQNLAQLNHQLVHHMQSISQEDEQVRNLIDRKDRVQRASQMVQYVQSSRKDLNLTSTKQSSFISGSYGTSPYRSKTGRSYY